MADNKCSQLRAASHLPPTYGTEVAVNVGQAAKELQECPIGLPGVIEGDPPAQGSFIEYCGQCVMGVADSLWEIVAHSLSFWRRP